MLDYMVVLSSAFKEIPSQFPDGCIILYSHQQHMSDLVSPQPHQHLVL